MPFTTVEEIEAANNRAGHTFFAPSAMAFFNSQILPTVYGGYFFITSEAPPKENDDAEDPIRTYSVRAAHDDGRITSVTAGIVPGVSHERAVQVAELSAALMLTVGRCSCAEHDRCFLPTEAFEATIHVPGFLPVDEEPPRFPTATDAWSYLAAERARAENLVNPDGEYSITLVKLNLIHGTCETGNAAAIVQLHGLRFDSTGSIIGPTPGCEPGVDLDGGLVYSVTKVTVPPQT